MKKFLDNKLLSTIVGILILAGLTYGIITSSKYMLFAGLWVVVAAATLFNAVGRNQK